MYPLGLRLTGRRVTVAGAGRVALRRVPRLLESGAEVLLVAPQAAIALRAMADEGRLVWRQRDFSPTDLDDAWLALAATDDAAVNAAVSAAAEQRRVFCVRADDAEAATAWTPAVTSRERLSVATFAAGDPRRAAALRDRLGELFDDGHLETPHFRPVSPAQPEVTLVGAGPGDPELITVAGRRALSAADVVIADRLAPPELLEGLSDDVDLIDASKVPYGQQMTQEEINTVLVDRALAGLRVVRLKGGDGFIFGRGGEEMDACAAEGIAVRVIPGVTSATAAPAVAGIPVTERGLVHEFTVVSGHLAPDDPANLVDWAALANLRGTLVLLMAVKQLPAIAATLLSWGRHGDTPVVAIMNAATSRQQVERGTLSVVSQMDVKSPAVIIIGEVARQR